MTEGDKPEYFVSSNTGKRTPRLDGKKGKDGNWESHDDIVKRCKDMGFDNLDSCPYTKEINESTGMPWLKALGYDSKKSTKNRKSQQKRKAKKASAKEAAESAVPTADSEVIEDDAKEPMDTEMPKESEDKPEESDAKAEETEDVDIANVKVEVKEDAQATYSALKMPELREKCTERGLPSSGNKQQLINLLMEADEKSSADQK